MTQGQYAQAEPLYKRSLAIREKALGPDHPDVATSLNNLAELYRAQNQYAQAEPLYKRSLAIREKAFGVSHPLPPVKEAGEPGNVGGADEVLSEVDVGKDWLTTLLLCIFLGGLGIHRFYTGHTLIGVIQLLTFGGFYIWAIIDLIMIITGSYRDSNGNHLVDHRHQSYAGD